MKRKGKKSNTKKILIIVGFILILGLLGYLAIPNSIFVNYESVPLSYSGTIDSLGGYNSIGFIVDGSYQCGGRSNSRGVVYTGCKIDYSSLDFIEYRICTNSEIKDINTINLKLTGNTGCLDARGSRSCTGSINFYSEDNILLGSYQQDMFSYSDGWRDTDKIDGYVNLNMESYDLLGEKCFSVLVSNPSKTTNTGDVRFNYQITEAQIDYEPVDCVNNSECEYYEICNNYKCELKPEIDYTPEENQDGTDMPDNEQNTTIGDNNNLPTEDSITHIYFYIIPTIIFGLIALIVWMKIKKPKRKKR